MTNLPIVGLGNALVDVLAPVEASAIARHGLRLSGMHLVDGPAADALLSVITPSAMQSGGSVANTMAHLGASGRAATYIGKVDEDDLGAEFAADMSRQGVAFPVAPISNGPGTGRCVVLVTPDGERTMSTYLGAAVTLSPEDVEASMPRALSLLFVEGYLWDAPEGAAVIEAATAIAKAAGARIALTPADPGCVERNLKEIRAFIGTHCNVLIGNSDEMCMLAGVSDAQSALDWARKQVEIGVVTLSEDGSMAGNAQGTVSIPADHVERVVDATGAGDAYAAGFLGALTEGAGIEQAARAGNALAARVITHLGAREAAA